MFCGFMLIFANANVCSNEHFFCWCKLASGMCGFNNVNNPRPHIETPPQRTTVNKLERQSDSKVRHEIFQLVANKYLSKHMQNRRVRPPKSKYGGLLKIKANMCKLFIIPSSARQLYMSGHCSQTYQEERGCPKHSELQGSRDQTLWGLTVFGHIVGIYGVVVATPLLNCSRTRHKVYGGMVP